MIITESDNFEICPECNGFLGYSQERGEIVCLACGLIISEREIDRSSIKRAYTQDEINKKRTNDITTDEMPIEFMTYIDKKDRRRVNNNLQRVFKKDSNMKWLHRNYLIANTELKRLASNLHIPLYIRKNAFRLYKEVQKHDILKGRSIKGIVLCCLIYMCKKENFHLTYTDFITQTDEAKGEINKYLRFLIWLVQEKHIKIHNENISKNLRKVNQKYKAVELIPKFNKDLCLDSETENLAKKILKSYIDKNFISAVSPKGLCAGCLYYTCKIKNIQRTQKDISKLIGVTEVTLRSRYKDIKTKTNLEDFL